MSKLKIVLNRKEVRRQLLQSNEMKNILWSHASSISKRGGGNVSVRNMGTRVVARVTGDDGKNKLVKAMRNKKEK